MRKGFTLLELLLVIAILAILAAAIGPQFVNSAKQNLDASRRERFAANYQSCMLAASMFLLASDTRLNVRTDVYSTYDVTGAGPLTGGLRMLVASGVLSMDTCTYENIAGQKRFFVMKVNDGVSAASLAGQASASVYCSIAGAGAGTPLGTIGVTYPMEVALKTQSIAQLWEFIKTQ